MNGIGLANNVSRAIPRARVAAFRHSLLAGRGPNKIYIGAFG